MSSSLHEADPAERATEHLWGTTRPSQGSGTRQLVCALLCAILLTVSAAVDVDLPVWLYWLPHEPLTREELFADPLAHDWLLDAEIAQISVLSQKRQYAAAAEGAMKLLREEDLPPSQAKKLLMLAAVCRYRQQEAAESYALMAAHALLFAPRQQLAPPDRDICSKLQAYQRQLRLLELTALAEAITNRDHEAVMMRLGHERLTRDLTPYKTKREPIIENDLLRHRYVVEPWPDVQAAVDACIAACEPSMENPQAYLWRAKLHELREDWEQAVRDYRRFLHSDVERDEVYLLAQAGLARCLERFGDQKGAEGQYFLLLGQHYWTMKKHRKAGQAFTRFMELSPESEWAPRASLMVGFSWMSQEDWDRAAKGFAQVIERWPDDPKVTPEALYWRTDALVKLGRYDEAIATLKRLIHEFPGPKWSHSARRISEIKRQKAEAEDADAR